MLKNTKLLAVMLSVMMVFSAVVIPVSAIDIELDLGGLFDPANPGDGGDTTPDTGDTDNGGDTTPDTGDTDNGGDTTPDTGDTDNGGDTTPDTGDTDNGGDTTPDTGDTDNGGDTTPDTGDTDNSGDTTPPLTDKKPNYSVKDNTSKNDKEDNKEEEKTEEKTEEEKEPVVYNSTFPDVKEEDWFYQYVTPLAAKGIITGYDTGDFQPQGLITRAEFLKMLVQCMEYEAVSNDVFKDVTSDKWYYETIATAAANGLISVEEYGEELKPDEKILRTEAALLLVKATGVETGKYVTPYKDTEDENIVALYSICLMQGTKDDKTGDRYFYPETNITRAETSAVLTRLLEYIQNPEKFVNEKSAEYGITLTPVDTPETNKEANDIINDAGETQASSFLLRIKRDADINEVFSYLADAFENNSINNPENFTLLAMKVETVPDTTPEGEYKTVIRVEFVSRSEKYSINELMDMKAEAKVKAKEIAAEIVRETQGKSQLEIAYRIHDYILQNVSYDEAMADDAVYTGYGALVQGKAVCQGYSAAFNLIAKECGIESAAVANDEHMWNVAVCDKNIVYFDCTWDDTGDDSTLYRGVDKSVMEKAQGDFAVNNYWRKNNRND